MRKSIPFTTSAAATPAIRDPAIVDRGLTCTTQTSPMEAVEFSRVLACELQSREERVKLGQFFTPLPVAERMVSLFELPQTMIRILDPGAGVGTLSVALVSFLAQRALPPREIHVTAIESDQGLIEFLTASLRACQSKCAELSIPLTVEVLNEDFLSFAAHRISHNLYEAPQKQFDCAILNPPYLKIHSASPRRKLLDSLMVPTSNMYSAFVGLSVQLLAANGELVAITPRSFCNGPYFRDFRRQFLDQMTLKALHIYSARNRAFSDDKVLQENLILAAVKRSSKPTDEVEIHTSTDALVGDDTMLKVAYENAVHALDADKVIHLVPDDIQRETADRIHRLPATLRDLDLDVSTGKVVDFRSQACLRQVPTKDSVPLLYAAHLASGRVVWPKIPSRKPNAILRCLETEKLLIPSATYVLTKRFTTKEEKRRLVAVVLEPADIPSDVVGVENHLNYFHRRGRGLPDAVAHGLAMYLNSTIVDEYFRQFNGHTQVNATDLRALRYPSLDTLSVLGELDAARTLQQSTIDQIIEQKVFNMSPGQDLSPSVTKKKVAEALKVLRALGLPRAQQNERSALTLLALLDLKPNTPWNEAKNPLRGITEMMAYFKEHYGKHYAPNSRETVRKSTVHQFLQAAICVQNPDQTRATNSPQFSYQVSEGMLKLLQAFETSNWDNLLALHLVQVATLQEQYARKRDMERIPVTLGEGQRTTLSPGAHSELVKAIIEEFCSRFTPGGRVLYVGDTEDKWASFDHEQMASLGVVVEQHGKMPDVVVYHLKQNWLVLIEAVTSHGPVSPKRHRELADLFHASRAGLVFITAFATKKAMTKYLGEISWETEVWIADHPSHLIHFDGVRFLGPYDQPKRKL